MTSKNTNESAQQIIPLANIAGRLYRLKNGDFVCVISVEANVFGQPFRLTGDQEIERIKDALSGMNTEFMIIMLQKIIGANTALKEIDDAIGFYEQEFRKNPDTQYAKTCLLRKERALRVYRIETENEVYYQNQRKSLANIVIKSEHGKADEADLREKAERIAAHLKSLGFTAQITSDIDLYELAALYLEPETAATPLPDTTTMIPFFEGRAS